MSTEEYRHPIPLVDLGELGLEHVPEPSGEEWRRVGKEIVDTFKDIGFVYLTGHGVPQEQITKMVNAGASFFDLPQRERDKYKRDPEKKQGYVAPNSEKFDNSQTFELREAYDIINTEGVLPDAEVPDFRPSAVDFRRSCAKLSCRLLVAIALGLELDRNFFLDGHRQESALAFRLLHYPPVATDEVLAGVTRCGTHTDYGTLTLLFQDDMGGLQVKEQGGNWISADPIPGTILVNVGDLLQFWTSGKLRATEHRVQIPAEEIRRQKPRRSTAFFIDPDGSTVIRPIDESSSTETSMTALEYIERRMSETHQK